MNELNFPLSDALQQYAKDAAVFDLEYMYVRLFNDGVDTHRILCRGIETNNIWVCLGGGGKPLHFASEEHTQSFLSEVKKQKLERKK